jgi:hypothetical protein
MSMPSFPPVDPSLNQESALNMILQSIALEEVALSHIINAEGEKIQAVVAAVSRKCCDTDMQKVLEVNKSVHNVLEQVKEMQMLLKSKMSRALEYMPKPEPLPPKPKPEPKPPHCCCPTGKTCFCKPVTTIFKIYRSDWTKNKALNLSRTGFCDGDIKLQRNYCGESLLILAKNKYSVEFNIKLEKEQPDEPVFLDCKIYKNDEEAENIIFSAEGGKLTGGFIHDANANADRHTGKSLVSMKICSGHKIKIESGIVAITKENAQV